MTKKIGWAFAVLVIIGLIWAGYDLKIAAPKRGKQCTEKVKAGDILTVNPANNPFNQTMFEYQKVVRVENDSVVIRRGREISSIAQTSDKFSEPDFFLAETERIPITKFLSQNFLDGFCD